VALEASISIAEINVK
jgi:RNA recognition motif-containing protein